MTAAPLTKYYAAYGSNLCKAQMKRRCPKAVPLGGFELPKAQLIFNGVADLVFHPSKTAMIGLWKITEACEHSLDICEGVIGKEGKPLKFGAYRKETIRVIVTENGREVERDAVIYVMNRDTRKMPMLSYLNTIKEGFRDFGLDEKWLNEALKDTAREVKRQDAEDAARLARADAERDTQLRLPYYQKQRSPHHSITNAFDGPSYSRAQAEYYDRLSGDFDERRGDKLDDIIWDDREEIERIRSEAEAEFNEFDEETYTYVRSKNPRSFNTVEDILKATAELKQEMKRADPKKPVEVKSKSGYKLPDAKPSPHLFAPTPKWKSR